MKNRILILAGLATLLSSTSNADDFLNIRTNPFMILGSSFVNLELDFRVTDHWSIGPSVQTSTFEPLYDVGIRTTYFEQGAFQEGWMTGLELKYSETTDGDRFYNDELNQFCVYEDEGEICGGGADQQVSLAVNHGYFWRWDTFNAGLGMGSAVVVPFEESVGMLVRSSLYFSIGWVR